MALNQDVRRDLARAAHGQDFIADAPVCLVVSADPDAYAAKYSERGENLYCIQDTAAATQNILLAATAFGLGSCWTGDFDEETVRTAAGIPADYWPLALVPIGYSDEEPSPGPMRPQEEVVRILQ